MCAAQVQSQDAVDVHVHIVVAGEFKVEVVLIDELRLTAQGVASVRMLRADGSGDVSIFILLIWTVSLVRRIA